MDVIFPRLQEGTAAQVKPLREEQAVQSDTSIRPSSFTWWRVRPSGIIGVGGGVVSRFERREVGSDCGPD